MKAILAVDQGTTASKAALFDLSGRLLALGRSSLRTKLGPGGRAEQDPLEILSTQRLAIARAMSKAGRPDVLAAGIATQRSTFVIWDRATGRPVGPAPTWQSTVAADLCARLAAHSGRVRRVTGLPLSPHYSASKVARVLGGIRDARRRADSGDLLFGNVATYLIWHFTGGRVHATDPTQAARTLLFDIQKLDWDPWLLDLFRIPRAMLPEVRPSLGDFGTMRLGVRDVPLRACLGDQQAALMGALGIAGEPGGEQALVNYGTGAFVLIPTGSKVLRRKGLLTSLAWTSVSQRCYLLEGTVNAAGASLDWLRRELGAPASLDEIDRFCRRGTGQALLLPTFWGLGSCFGSSRDSRLPSLTVNLGLSQTLADLTRAAVEAVAHLVAVILERASGSGAPAVRCLVAAGSLASLRYLLELQAALPPGLPVIAAPHKEATLLGVAGAAAQTSGGMSMGREGAGPAGSHAIRASARIKRLAARRHENWRQLIQMARFWRDRSEARS